MPPGHRPTHVGRKAIGLESRLFHDHDALSELLTILRRDLFSGHNQDGNPGRAVSMAFWIGKIERCVRFGIRD